MTISESPPSISVLVAEDDRVISDVIRFNLERAKCRVTVARNGTEAWEQLQSKPFDILVTDYQMPGMTGEEVSRAFRTKYPESQLPIILLSARGLELSATRLHDELGIERLFYKPFSPRELVEEVLKCVKNPVPVN